MKSIIAHIRSIDSEIEEIENSNFEISEIQNFKTINLLMMASSCYRHIDNFCDIKNKNILLNKLNNVMVNKLKELNSSFSETTLRNIVSSYNRCDLIPLDILVNDDAVFYKIGFLNDCNDIYKWNTFMFEYMLPYRNIKTDFFRHFDSNKFDLTLEEEVYTNSFVNNYIDLLYKKIYGNDSCRVDDTDTNIYINMGLSNICYNFIMKKECDIKICFHNGYNIIIYYIHQSFKDNKPIWTVVKKSDEIWRMTTEVSKLMENNNALKLTK